MCRTTCRTTSDTNPTRNKPTVKFLSVSSRKMARWTPIQEQAKALLLESISRSSRCVWMCPRIVARNYSHYLHGDNGNPMLPCMVLFCSYKTVNKATRNLFREQLEKVITKVRNELATAAAPNARRLKSYSNLNSKMVGEAYNVDFISKHNTVLNMLSCMYYRLGLVMCTVHACMCTLCTSS